MRGDGMGGLAMAIAIVIGTAILAPGIVAGCWAWRRFRRGRGSIWLVPTVAALGFGGGIYLAFFVIFDDLGDTYLAARAAPTIVVRVPPEVRGSVYLFFDPALPPLSPSARKRYQLDMPASGRVIVGPIPEMDRVMDYTTVTLQYPDGTSPPQVTLASQSGTINGVWHRRFFIGTDAEERADDARREAEGRLFDEEAIYRQLKERPTER